MANLSTLPPEVLLLIGKQLTFERLAALSSTCQLVRKAVIPLLLEVIYFPAYDPDTALACLKQFSTEALSRVRKIVINTVGYDIYDRPTYRKQSEADLHFTWANVVQCLPSLQEISFQIVAVEGVIDAYLRPPSFRRLVQNTFPTIAKERPSLSFNVIVRNDISDQWTMYTSGLEQIFHCFKQIPGKYRIILLFGLLEWTDGIYPPDPTILLDAIASSRADIYQIRNPNNVASELDIRDLRPWHGGRYLDLKGIYLDLKHAIHLLDRCGPDLQDLSLSLSESDFESATRHVALPNLTRLRLWCWRWPWFQDLTVQEQMSTLRAAKKFFGLVDMPSLEICSLNVPAWVLAIAHEVLTALKAMPHLRQVQAVYSTQNATGEKERLQATQGLIADLEAVGISTTLRIKAKSFRPADTLLESRFENWLPWYPTLKTHVTSLDLEFTSMGLPSGFPAGLVLHDHLDFPALQSLSLEAPCMKSKFYQASTICSKIRAPRLRHLELNVNDLGGEPLLHAVLAMLPEQASLATLSISAPVQCFLNVGSSCETLCREMDLACANVHRA